MGTAILGIILALIPFTIWLIKRKLNAETPSTVYEDNVQKGDKAIATGNERVLNEHVNDLLREIHSNSGGQGDQKGGGKPNV